MNKAKIALIIGVIAIFAAPIIIGFAIPDWSKTFNLIYEEPPVPSFQVYTDAAHTTVWDQTPQEWHSTDPTTKTFYILNDGTADITVQVTGESNTNLANTITWSSKSLSLDVGDSGSLTLTVNIAEDGQYSFHFTC